MMPTSDLKYLVATLKSCLFFKHKGITLHRCIWLQSARQQSPHEAKENNSKLEPKDKEKFKSINMDKQKVVMRENT